MFQSQPQDPTPQNQRRRQMFLLALFALAVLLLGQTGALDQGGFLGGGLGGTGGSAVRYQQVRDAADLQRAYGAAGYDLQAVRDGAAAVPQLFLDRLPQGWDALPEAERRELFTAALLPLVLATNAQLEALRARLATAADAPDAAALAEAELELLQDVAAALPGLPLPAEPLAAARQLAARIGPLPVGLTIAQAARDSDWGAGAATRQHNRLFAGAADPPATGPFAAPTVRPGGAADGGFASLRDALAARAVVLAQAPDYAGFRAERDRLEAAHAPLQGPALAATLVPPDEAAALQDAVAAAGLDDFDAVRLAKPPATHLIARPGADESSEPSG